MIGRHVVMESVLIPVYIENVEIAILDNVPIKNLMDNVN